MPQYEGTLLNPPGPLAKVTLRNPATGISLSDIPMLLDTGSDISLVPHSIAEKIGLEIRAENGYQLLGFDGNASDALSVEADLFFFSGTFSGRFLLIHQEYGIIGRNVLNQVILNLNGPAQSWDVSIEAS